MDEVEPRERYALTKRINRRLAHRGMKLRECRGIVYDNVYYRLVGAGFTYKLDYEAVVMVARLLGVRA
jgi:hypothetical protein